MHFKNLLSAYAKYVLPSVLLVIVFISCQKTLDGDISPVLPVVSPTAADLTTKVNSSVSGFVTDGSEAPIKDATVQYGNATILTDKYGYFEIRNVQVIQNAAMVSVTKAGFFKGFKTHLGTANKSAFFRIKLIPKTSAGTFAALTGGTVTLPTNLSISFPANAIVNANTNAAYTGVVNVNAFKIDPTAVDLQRIMPGDLRGLNTDSQLQLLTTYGMAAVELTGAGGEILQIATGKKATMTMPIAATLLANAPATIPLWYFDETLGLWKQEGSATKTGTNYVGDVSHFSFWNYDVPSNYVQFNCTVVNTAGQPVQNAYVKISLVSNPNNAGYGYTDSSGYTHGAVPNNAQLKLEVFANATCGGVAAFSQNFSTTNVNIAFGNATINTTTNVATLTGSVKNCAGLPVTNGYVVIREGNLYNRIALSNTGTYSHNKLFCSFPTQITLVGEDVTNLQQNLPVTYVVTAAGVNNIPAITACGVNTQQFINYTINGAAYNFTAPTDTLVFSNPTSGNNSAGVYGSTMNGNSYIRFGMNGAGLALNSSQALDFFSTSQINDSSFITTPALVNITEYGAVGQFVAGNLSGSLTGPPPTNTIYNITCNFRIRRNN
jgi:hypothetical protein